MRKVSHKSSARNRSPLTSIGSVRRIKQLRSASRTQLNGENMNLWLDATSLSAPLNMAVSKFPARKGNAPISAGALRPVVDQKGFMFGGAQAMWKTNGEDTFGYDEVTIIITHLRTDNSGYGALMETYTPFWYAGEALAMTMYPGEVQGYSMGGVVNGSGLFSGVPFLNKTAAMATSLSRVLPFPEAITTSTNGNEPNLDSSSVGTFTGPFNSNYLYIGARGANSVFYIGLIKSVIIMPKSHIQQETNGLSRMSFWSVK